MLNNILRETSLWMDDYHNLAEVVKFQVHYTKLLQLSNELDILIM